MSRAALGGQTAQQRRGAADRREYHQAAEAFTETKKALRLAAN